MRSLSGPQHFGPAKLGRARFVVEKFDKDPKVLWDNGLEIYHSDSFYDDFISTSSEHGVMDFAADVLGEHEFAEGLRDILKDAENGFYEIVGDLHYEFDPGFDSPNGPAEADAWAWLEKPEFVKLTEKQASWWIPPPPPPPPQAWEHNTKDAREGRFTEQCAHCKKWVHRCSNCSYMDWAEENYCSENCWKAAGSPKDPQETAA